MKELLFIDFESYYNTADRFDLKHISISEYVRDERFKSFGAALGFNKENATWLSHNDLVKELKTINWGNVALVNHNSKFDAGILVWRYGCHPSSFIDTLSMSRAVLGTKIRKFSLASLAEYYGLEAKGFLQTNGLRDLSAQQEKELGEYCEHDTNLCRDIFYKLQETFPASQYWHMDWTIRAFVYPKLVLDVPLLKETAIKERERRNNIFKEIGIEKKIFSSNDKFADLLRKEGYAVPTKESPSTGKDIPAFALGDEEFQEMVNSDDIRLSDLCEARIAAKSNLLETRSEKLAKVGVYGAFPFDVQFSGAKQTHRYSGGSGGGGNPQNFKRNSNLRKAVKVPGGYKLIVSDFKSIELVIVAFLSGDPVLLDMIRKKVDPYCAFASDIYRRIVQEKDESERKYGKTGMLSLQYASGWEKLQHMSFIQNKLRIDDELARNTVYIYRNKFKGVPALWEKLEMVLDRMVRGQSGVIFESPLITFKGNEVTLPSGLKLRYPNLRKEQGKKYEEFVYDVFKKREESFKDKIYGGKFLENLSQALAGEICKEAIKRCEDKGLNVVLQLHDELAVVVDENKLAESKSMVYTCMTETIPWWKEILLNCSLGSSDNWLEAK